MSSHINRCAAAHVEDPDPCEGPEVVRILDRCGDEARACVHHGARLYASLDDARVRPLPGHDGQALAVYYRAQDTAPFAWIAGRSA